MKLVFLGKLADVAGGPELDIAAEGPLGWAALLARMDTDFAAALSGENVRVAHNGIVLADKTALVAAPSDEIAFLPPVSGG